MDGNNSHTAWALRMQAGQAMEYMAVALGSMGPEKVYSLFSKWTDRLAEGELPFDKPERPKGIERNVVYTMWDWASPKHYQHDAISTDKRNPTVNANGLIYGSPEESTDLVPTLDPVKNIASTIKHPYLDPKTPFVAGCRHADHRPIGAMRRSGTATPAFTMSSWTSRARSGSPRACGRRENPDYCKQGSDPSFGESRAAGDLVAPALALRSDDRQVGPDQHLLHAPIISTSRMIQTIRFG